MDSIQVVPIKSPRSNISITDKDFFLFCERQVFEDGNRLYFAIKIAPLYDKKQRWRDERDGFENLTILNQKNEIWYRFIP